jgi:hypothetical protein
MATRSSISIRNADGSYTGIYCHFDGYLTNNGRILCEHYTNEDKIRELMALGDISSLKPEIGEQHPFDGPCMFSDPKAYDAYKAKFGSWCKAYGRDRGEPDCEARTHPTLEALMDQIEQEYDYLWDGEQWMVRFYTTDTRFVPLEEALALEAAEEGEE